MSHPAQVLANQIVCFSYIRRSVSNKARHAAQKHLFKICSDHLVKIVLNVKFATTLQIFKRFAFD